MNELGGRRCDADQKKRGWILPSFLFFPQVLAVSELCSSMPVNGGAFWWTAALAPSKLSRPLSFISGCTTIASIFAGVASYAYAIASLLCVSISFLSSGFSPSAAQQMGIAIGVLLIWTMSMLVRLDNISTVFMVCGQSYLFGQCAYSIRVRRHPNANIS